MPFSVTTKIEKSEYLELVGVARENGSTIGSVVRLAIKFLIPKLKDPKVLSQLEPDPRVQNVRMRK